MQTVDDKVNGYLDHYCHFTPKKPTTKKLNKTTKKPTINHPPIKNKTNKEKNKQKKQQQKNPTKQPEKHTN